MVTESSGNRRCLLTRFSAPQIGHALFEQGAKAGPLSRLYTDQIGDSALLLAQHLTRILQRASDEAADRDVRMPAYTCGERLVFVDALCQVLEINPLATDRITGWSHDLTGVRWLCTMTTQSRKTLI